MIPVACGFKKCLNRGQSGRNSHFVRAEEKTQEYQAGVIHIHLLPDLAVLIRFQEFGGDHPFPDHGIEYIHFRLEIRNSKVPDLED